MTFHAKLQQLRKEKGLSQEELADKLEVSRQAISKWEVGEVPNLENLVKLSRFFDCSLDYLVNDDALDLGKGEEEPPVPKKKWKLHWPSLLLGAVIPLLILAAALLLRSAAAPDMDSQAAWNGRWLLFLDWPGEVDDRQAGYMMVDNGAMHAYLEGDHTTSNINLNYTYENGLFDSDVTSGAPFAPKLVSPSRIVLDQGSGHMRWKLVRPGFEHCELFETEGAWGTYLLDIDPACREFDVTVTCELGTIDAYLVDDSGQRVKQRQTLIADSETPSFTIHLLRPKEYDGDYYLTLRGQNGFYAAGWYAWK